MAFIEVAASNNGYQFKMFFKKEDALGWLLEEG
jgi:hypothetical protein